MFMLHQNLFLVSHFLVIERSRQIRQSVGDELDVVEADKVAKTNAEENKHRRTIILNRVDDQSWGFTIQSYGIHHTKEDEIEMLTYVDYVAHSSPAFLSGMRPGDVILSINGTNMEDEDHESLIEFVKSCHNTMRMVVLFEDCCRKVELHHRYLKLKRVLAEKIFEVRSLEHQEMRIMSGLSRFDSCRSSRVSTASSNSFLDDRLSLLPELDRCPTPRNNLRGSFNTSPYSPDSLHSPIYSSSRSLSPLPRSTASRFDFDHSSLPMRKHQRPHSLAASVSVHAALNASLKNGYEASGGRASPNLSRTSPISFNASPIHEHSDGETSPLWHKSRPVQKLHPQSSTPDYSLPAPNRSLRRSGRHASAPDKLNPPQLGLSEQLEMSLFKLHVTGADSGESSTEVPGDTGNGPAISKVASSSKPKAHLGISRLQSPPKTSSLPQLSDYAEKHGVKADTSRSAISLNSSGGSAQFQLDSSVDSLSFRCSSTASDPGSPYSIGACSTNCSFSYSDIPAIEVEMVNDEDAVSHL